MHKLYKIICVLAIFTISFLFSAPIHAISQNVVISQVQLGDKLSAKNEFIELYNNSDNDVDISNWCLYYQSSTLKTEELTCFDTDNEQTHVFLPGHSTVFAVSSDLAISSSPLIGDVTFSATLSGTAGYVFISDSKDVEIDKVGWGVATEILDLTPAAPVGEVIGRKIIENTNLLQDTDVNLDDFELVAPKTIYSYGSIYEVYDVCKNIEAIQENVLDGYLVDENGDCSLPPIDICKNIEGLQSVIPINYEQDENGDCQIDECSNIDGLQLILPQGMVLNEAGSCVEFDYCPNLVGTQPELPPDYYLSQVGECKHNVLLLQISEVLPNVTGVDDGKEFIEIFNPNEVDIDLSKYMFSAGIGDGEKYFEFPADSIIEAGKYLAFYNLAIPFTLKNTNDAVRIYSIDNVLLDEMLLYENPKVDETWAKINNSWQYSNRPTPGSENLGYFQAVKEVAADEAELAPCGVNQYRSSETNRCRNIVISESTLAPCKDGQYRSEETNRCRNIVSDVVEYMPCDEGQERNPETNRCRSVIAGSVLGASDLAPCPEGQERNLETNRCRKVVGEIPEAEYKTEPVSQSGSNNILWWSLGGVGIIAVVYAIWEWRREIIRLIQKISLLLHRKNY